MHLLVVAYRVTHDLKIGFGDKAEFDYSSSRIRSRKDWTIEVTSLNRANGRFGRLRIRSDRFRHKRSDMRISEIRNHSLFHARNRMKVFTARPI